MRKYVITGLVFLAVLGLNAQEAKVNLKKGDILEIVKLKWISLTKVKIIQIN